MSLFEQLWTSYQWQKGLLGLFVENLLNGILGSVVYAAVHYVHYRLTVSTWRMLAIFDDDDDEVAWYHVAFTDVIGVILALIRWNSIGNLVFMGELYNSFGYCYGTSIGLCIAVHYAQALRSWPKVRIRLV